MGAQAHSKIRDISREQSNVKQIHIHIRKSHIILKMKIFSFTLAFYYTPGICSVLSVFKNVFNLYMYRVESERDEVQGEMMEGKEINDERERVSGMWK